MLNLNSLFAIFTRIHLFNLATIYFNLLSHLNLYRFFPNLLIICQFSPVFRNHFLCIDQPLIYTIVIMNTVVLINQLHLAISTLYFHFLLTDLSIFPNLINFLKALIEVIIANHKQCCNLSLSILAKSLNRTLFITSVFYQ